MIEKRANGHVSELNTKKDAFCWIEKDPSYYITMSWHVDLIADIVLPATSKVRQPTLHRETHQGDAVTIILGLGLD